MGSCNMAIIHPTHLPQLRPSRHAADTAAGKEKETFLNSDLSEVQQTLAWKWNLGWDSNIDCMKSKVLVHRFWIIQFRRNMIEKVDASGSKETKTMYFSKHLLVLACFPYRPHLRNSEGWLEGVTKATVGVGFILGACTWTLRNTFSSLSSAFSAPCKSPLGKGSWVFLERLHPVLFQNNKDLRSSKKTKNQQNLLESEMLNPFDILMTLSTSNRGSRLPTLQITHFHTSSWTTHPEAFKNVNGFINC